MPSKVALITGAGRGIGFATARAFAEAGYSVVIAERCVRRAVDRFGHIDCAVNNAGVIQVGRLEQLSRADVMEIVRVWPASFFRSPPDDGGWRAERAST